MYRPVDQHYEADRGGGPQEYAQQATLTCPSDHVQFAGTSAGSLLQVRRNGWVNLLSVSPPSISCISHTSRTAELANHISSIATAIKLGVESLIPGTLGGRELSSRVPVPKMLAHHSAKGGGTELPLSEAWGSAGLCPLRSGRPRRDGLGSTPLPSFNCDDTVGVYLHKFAANRVTAVGIIGVTDGSL